MKIKKSEIRILDLLLHSGNVFTASLRCTSLVPLLIMMTLALVGSHEAHSGWNHSDPECSGVFQPSKEEIEEWIEWWTECIIDVTGSDPPDPVVDPPLCHPGERFTYTDASGRCWEMTCGLNHQPIIRPCAGHIVGWENVFPRIEAVKLNVNGYSVFILGKSGIREEKVSPKEVKLSSVVRATMRGVKLPTERIREVPVDFWAKQKKVILKPVICPSNNKK